jgi:hypothetical protein
VTLDFAPMMAPPVDADRPAATIDIRRAFNTLESAVNDYIHKREARPRRMSSSQRHDFRPQVELLRCPGLRPEPVAPSGSLGRRAWLSPAAGRVCAGG